MKPSVRRTGLAGLLLAGLGYLFWQVGPFTAVFAIANLSDPARLSALAERGANSRLNKVVYWLDYGRDRFMPAGTAVALAQLRNGTHEPRAALVKAALLRNLKIADELGLLTSENRARLRQGHAATITQGPYAGETVEIDHVVPLSLAPELGNELANLEMIPKSINRRKSNHVGARQMEKAGAFYQAGLIQETSLKRVRDKYQP